MTILFRFELLMVLRTTKILSDDINTYVIKVVDLIVREYPYSGLEVDADVTSSSRSVGRSV